MISEYSNKNIDNHSLEMCKINQNNKDAILNNVKN